MNYRVKTADGNWVNAHSIDDALEKYCEGRICRDCILDSSKAIELGGPPSACLTCDECGREELIRRFGSHLIISDGQTANEHTNDTPKLQSVRRAIAVDFDGCICTNNYPDIGVADTKVIKALLKEKAKGTALILWTCRGGEELKEAIDACKKWGVEFDAVNQNLPDWKEYYKNDCRKVGASEYWDDRAKCVKALCDSASKTIEYSDGIEISEDDARHLSAFVTRYAPELLKTAKTESETVDACGEIKQLMVISSKIDDAIESEENRRERV